MSLSLLTVAIAVVRGWTRLYTLPLDAAARATRRAEIESDLWEGQHDQSVQESRAYQATDVLLRMLRGVPDDLRWSWEQLPAQPSALRLSVAFRIAVVGIVGSTLVVSASKPTVDLTHTLRVNVLSTGWLEVDRGRMDATRVPALSFTLTNAADRVLGAIQVNALFYDRGEHDSGWGTAFSWAVGSPGLSPGATSRVLVLQPHGWARDGSANMRRPLHPVIGPTDLGASRVTLFVKHEGRWTPFGDYPIQNQVMDP